MGAYPHLERIANDLGVAFEGKPSLEWSPGDERVTFALTLDSGTVRGLSIHVTAGPYPEVRLRPEDAQDKVGKEKGLNREVQLDDAAFDERVYIDSHASDDAVRAVLLADGARAAVLALLDLGASEVSIGATGVTVVARTEDNSPGAPLFEPKHLRALHAKAKVLAALPAFADTGAPRKPRGTWLFAVIGPGFVVGLGLFILGMLRYEPTGVTLPLIAGAVGLVASVLAWPLFRVAVRGDPRSFGRYRAAQVASFFVLPLLTLGTAIFVNGAFDGAPVAVRVGKIASIDSHGDDDDDGTTRVTVAWKEGGTSSITFDDAHGDLRAGNRVEARVHPGRLGFAWADDDVVAKSGTSEP